MRTLIEIAGFIFAAGSALTLCFVATSSRFIKPSAPDKCKHRRWTKWKIEQIQPIHLYSQVDEGVSLPDRVDAYMIRECVSCGTPQAKTVRGIDSSQFK